MRLEQSVRFTLETSLVHPYLDRDVYDTAELPRKMILSSDSYSFGRLGLRLQALRNFCQAIAATSKCKFYVDKKMYEMRLNRIVEICNLDNQTDLKSFNDKEFKFILATNDKLIYPSEVVDVLGIKQTKISFAEYKTSPVYIERFDGNNAKCRSLTDKDIVVDTNLNQIWPLSTKRPNRPPVEMVQLLKRIKEKLY
ncbi:MAG: hypothetical protein J5611_03125 [Alphaproteobacteria bacterium]|nr:hypothetical protein [Alphaproteobacteria bacterium]